MSVTINGSSNISLDTSSGYPRITGDFSNATNASRVSFQTSTANSSTVVNVIPSGTGSRADLRLFNSSDPDNASNLIIGAGVTGEVRFSSTITGTGTYLPMTFYTGGSESARISTSGIFSCNLTQSLAASGYIKLPSGVIIQWGTCPSSTSATVTFPIAFPNAAYIVEATSTGGSGGIPRLNTLTTTNFNWAPANAATSAYYMALGY